MNLTDVDFSDLRDIRSVRQLSSRDKAIVMNDRDNKPYTIPVSELGGGSIESRFTQREPELTWDRFTNHVREGSNSIDFTKRIESTKDIVAYSKGSGAPEASGTYSVDQLNVSGNIAIGGDNIFDTDPVNTTKRIPVAWISGAISADSVDWANINNKPSTESAWATETGFDNRYLQGETYSTPNDLENALGVASAEFDQVAKINLVTISNAQWGYVGGLDQSLATSSSVQFSKITSTGAIIGNASDVAVDGGLQDSQVVRLVGKYDSDGTAAIASTAYNFEIQHVMLSTTPTSKASLLYGGVEQAHVTNSGAGIFKGDLTAYSGGSGASESAGTYTVDQLNANTNVAIRGEQLFETNSLMLRSAIVPSSGSGDVASVFGRIGDVVAEIGDYSFSQISGSASAAQLPSTVAYEGDNISVFNNDLGYTQAPVAETITGAWSFESNTILDGAPVTVDGGVNPSSDLILRGHYDSDGTTAINSTAYDAVFRHVIESTVPQSRMALLFGGAEQFSIDESGNVGIGGANTNTSGSALHVQKTAGNTAVGIQNSTGDAHTWFNYHSSGNNYITGDVSGGYGNTHIRKWDATNGYADIAIFRASGVMELRQPNNGVLRLARGSGNASIIPYGSEAWMIVDGNGSLGLNYYSTGKVIIANGGGTVGINTNSPSTAYSLEIDSGNGTNWSLLVRGRINTTGDRIRMYGTSTTNCRLEAYDRGSWTGDQSVDSGIGKMEYHAGQWYIASYDSKNYIVQFRNHNGSNVAEMGTNGVSYAVDHREGSDRRLKSKFRRIKSARSIAKYAKLYSFEKEHIEERIVGLIAQDIEKSGYKDIIHWKPHDKYGKVRTLSGYTLGSIALAGVGELDRDLEQVKSRTERLEERVQDLEIENRQLKQELNQLRAA